MRAVLLGMTALGLSGAAVTGLSGSDFDRTVARSPNEVYSAFSAIAPEGTETRESSDVPGGSITVKVDKEPGSAIHYEIRSGNDSVVTVDLDFASAQGGAATRLTGDFDINKAALGKILQKDGTPLVAVPDFVYDRIFSEYMSDAVKQIEAGQSLAAPSMASAGISEADSSNAAERRAEMRSDMREAAAPVASAKPMVDPNQSAREYLGQ